MSTLQAANMLMRSVPYQNPNSGAPTTAGLPACCGNCSPLPVFNHRLPRLGWADVLPSSAEP